MPQPRRISLLGSTGSIGTQAIDVVRAAPDRFVVAAICAGGSDVAALAAQAIELRVEAVGAVRADAVEPLRDALSAAAQMAGVPVPKVLAGPDVTEQIASWPVDIVLNGVAGSQGLRATLAALKAGAKVALANKESLVAGAPLVRAAAAPDALIPVDSEHSAIAQALRSGAPAEVAKLILTASGGPFRGRTRDELQSVTPDQALAHPTWAMGPLISANSATLVNKALELIEAHLLFDIDLDRIDVVVHPQSVVHSMVEFVDGSTIAQASPPDMRLPIALALAWPQRLPGAAAPVDWRTAHTWTFEPLDEVTFPAIAIARVAAAAGGCAPGVFNAANEQAVAAFFAGRIGFLGIVDGIDAVVQRWLATEHAAAGNPGTVEDVEEAEGWARAHLDEWAQRQR